MRMHYSGGYFLTVDVSKNKTKEYEPGIDGPNYRIARFGLNIESKCKNENCVAYNDVICVQIGYVQNWNLLEHMEEKVEKVLCPRCGNMIRPNNYHFLDCFYKIDFIKDEDGKFEKGSVIGKASSNKFKTFDKVESGKAFFVKLVFNVTQR